MVEDIQIDKRITASVHPVTMCAIETFKQEFRKAGEFEEFLYNWIDKEIKEFGLKLIEEFNKEFDDTELNPYNVKENCEEIIRKFI